MCTAYLIPVNILESLSRLVSVAGTLILARCKKTHKCDISTKQYQDLMDFLTHTSMSIYTSK